MRLNDKKRQLFKLFFIQTVSNIELLFSRWCFESNLSIPRIYSWNIIFLRYYIPEFIPETMLCDSSALIAAVFLLFTMATLFFARNFSQENVIIASQLIITPDQDKSISKSKSNYVFSSIATNWVCNRPGSRERKETVWKIWILQWKIFNRSVILLLWQV